MRNAGRLKLGYYPLPLSEAQNIRRLLSASAPYAAIDPCAGDGTALREITADSNASLAAIELDADRCLDSARQILERDEDEAVFCTPDICFQDAQRYIPDISERRGLDPDLGAPIVAQQIRPSCSRWQK